MNNKRATKRALLTSVTALVMCVVMLVGTTFAWFTDTASTGVNKIVAGNLDVALEMKNPDYNSTVPNSKEWISAEGKTLNFTKKVDVATDGSTAETTPAAEILWEPGCRYQLPELRVVNNGNLALKYKIQITGIQGDAKLNEVIDWTINDAAINLTEQRLAAKTAGEAFTIKGVMQTTAGNEYQGLSIDGIAITVYATQDTVENDSFGPDYDANARYYSDEPAVVDGGSATFTGNIAGDGAWGVIQAKNGAQVSINANVSAEESEDHYAMAVYATGLGTKVTISGGNFTQEINGTDNQYDLIYASGGAKIVITGGTFKIGGGDPKWTLNCKDNSGSTITVMGGSFYKFDPSAPRADQADEVIVPDTCKVIKSGDWYTVVPKTVTATTGTDGKDNTIATVLAANSAATEVAMNLPASETAYTLPGDKMQNKTVTITGTKDTVIDLTAGTAAHGASITMEGVTVESTNGNYTGIQHSTATIFKDCVIKGQPFLYAKDAQFINCTFEQNSSDAYNVWTYGAGSVLFKDCTFNCAGKSVLIYNEGSLASQNVEFQNCKFNASAPVAGKAAIEIDCTFTSYNVVIDKATADNVTNFADGSKSGSPVWNVKKGDKPTTVTVAGAVVYSK